MARIRTTKPEFWSSEQVMTCSREARLLFLGMWNFADDAGRLRDSDKTIKAQIFPGDLDIDSTSVRRWLDELSTNHLVLFYEAAGEKYIQITGWHHQRIDRPRKSKLPSPPGTFDDTSTNDRRSLDDSSTSVRRALAPDLTLPYPTQEDLKGAEGARPLEFDWKPKEETLAKAKADHGLTGTDLDTMLKRFVPHYRSRGEQRADWDEQFLCWCVDEAKKLGRTPAKPSEPPPPMQREFAPIATALRREIDEAVFAAWFQRVVVTIDEGKVTLTAPTKFVLHNWQTQYEAQIERAVRAAYPGAKAINLEIQPAKAAA